MSLSQILHGNPFTLLHIFCDLEITKIKEYRPYFLTNFIRRFYTETLYPSEARADECIEMAEPAISMFDAIHSIFEAANNFEGAEVILVIERRQQ